VMRDSAPPAAAPATKDWSGVGAFVLLLMSTAFEIRLSTFEAHWGFISFWGLYYYYTATSGLIHSLTV
jgi:hypothetical protein